jgi:hypothetical protein
VTVTAGMKRVHTIPLLLVLGYLLVFYSEFLFYGQRSDPTLPISPLVDLIPLLLAYSAMAYLLLSMIRFFRVQSLPGLLVAGAAYGWILEGMVVATMYEAIPFTISFTALAWHGPIDILLGLYWIPRQLQNSPPGKIALVFSGMGILWGFWLVWPWSEVGFGIQREVFLRFSLLTTGLLITAYWLLGRLDLKNFHPGRLPLILLGCLLALFYTQNAILNYGLLALILPFLLLLCGWALQQNRSRSPGGDILQDIGQKPRPLNLILLWLLPLTAYLTYSIFLVNSWHPPSNLILGLSGSLTGTALFLGAVWKLIKPDFISGLSQRNVS